MPALRAGVIALAVALVAAVGIGTFLSHRHRAAPAAKAPARTAAYTPRPGPRGTKILTETVDPLSIAVPNDWKAPPADLLTLPAEIDAFSHQAPSLGAALQAEAQVAAKAGVRLFAYRATAPFAFVSVVSYASPGAIPLSPQVVGAIVASIRKKSPTVAVKGVALPVGGAVQFDANSLRGNQLLELQVLVLATGGRTVLVEMASEAATAGVPPLFDQLAQSLSQK